MTSFLRIFLLGFLIISTFQVKLGTAAYNGRHDWLNLHGLPNRTRHNTALDALLKHIEACEGVACARDRLNDAFTERHYNFLPNDRAEAIEQTLREILERYYFFEEFSEKKRTIFIQEVRDAAYARPDLDIIDLIYARADLDVLLREYNIFSSDDHVSVSPSIIISLLDPRMPVKISLHFEENAPSDTYPPADELAALFKRLTGTNVNVLQDPKMPANATVYRLDGQLTLNGIGRVLSAIRTIEESHRVSFFTMKLAEKISIPEVRWNEKN